MKKLTALIFVFFITSCEKSPSPKEIVKTKIESHLFESLNDLDSYEFVKMSEFDTIFKIDHYQKMVKEYSDILESMSGYTTSIEKFRENAKFYISIGNETDAKESIDLADEMQNSYNDVVSD